MGEAQAVGKIGVRPVIEHWNGRRWQLMANPPVPSMTALSGVAVASDGEARAVGSQFVNDGRGLVLRWAKRARVTAATPVAMVLIVGRQGRDTTGTAHTGASARAFVVGVIRACLSG